MPDDAAAGGEPQEEPAEQAPASEPEPPRPDTWPDVMVTEKRTERGATEANATSAAQSRA